MSPGKRYHFTKINYSKRKQNVEPVTQNIQDNLLLLKISLNEHLKFSAQTTANLPLLRQTSRFFLFSLAGVCIKYGV